MTPSLKGSWGITRYYWEGYNWFYDSRFVDDGLTLAERAPWVVSSTITPMCGSPWRAHAWGDDQDRHGDGPVCQDLEDSQSVDSDDGTRARWMRSERG